MGNIIKKKDVNKPTIPINWDYNESVSKSKNLFKEVREKGAGALSELYIAWYLLKGDSKKKKDRKWPDKTFYNYCNDIEITEKTAYGWLHKYFDVPIRGILKNVSIPIYENPPQISNKSAIEFLSELPDKYADLLFTDPPYMTDVDDIYEFAESWLPLALKKIKDTGRAYVFIGQYPEELRAYLSISEPNQILIWSYNNTMTGNMPKKEYFNNGQTILYFIGKDAPDLDCPIDLEHLSCVNIPHPCRTQKRVYKYQKPDELAERYILHSTKENNIVIDPFAGSGTFLVAAAIHNRQSIGSEIDGDVIKIAESRGCNVCQEFQSSRTALFEDTANNPKCLAC